jgi:hypothetical protein
MFSKDPLTLHRMKIATFREYLDYEPILKRHCQHAISAAGR